MSAIQYMNCLLVFFLAIATSSASIVGFMPGDACFRTRITEAVLAAFNQDEHSFELHYEHPRGSGGFGGYAGFSRLRIVDMPDQMFDDIRYTYSMLRKYTPKLVRIEDSSDPKEPVAVEVNGFQLFIYNRDLDLSSIRIGLKYNEHWFSLPESAFVGPRRGGFGVVAAHIYDPFLRSYESVVEDWDLAVKVRGLAAEVPKNIAWGNTGPQILDPIVVNANAIQVVILDSDQLEAYFSREAGSEFSRIVTGELERLTWNDDGKLIKVPPNPLDDDDCE